jgi:hypothetical protein
MEPHPFRQAFVDRDLDRSLSLLADDVIVHSAVSPGTDFKGRGSATAIFTILFDALKEIEFTHDLGDERSHVLVSDAQVLGRPIKTTWLLESDAERKISEIWVMNRPLAGTIALTEAIGRAAEQAGRDSLLRELGEQVHQIAERLADLAADLDPVAKRMVEDLNRSTAQAPVE